MTLILVNKTEPSQITAAPQTDPVGWNAVNISAAENLRTLDQEPLLVLLCIGPSVLIRHTLASKECVLGSVSLDELLQTGQISTTVGAAEEVLRSTVPSVHQPLSGSASSD